jgi:DNA-binding PucR family transcriptional regulator
MSRGVRFGELMRRYTSDPEWLPSVARDVTDAIHARLPALDADELRQATYASSESVLRLLDYMVRNDVAPGDAEPPTAAVDYAREFVRRGVPLDALLRAYHIGHAVFFRRWAEAVHADPVADEIAAYAIEQGADWTFAFVEALSSGLVRRYADERERWVRSAAALRSQTVEAVLGDDVTDLPAVSARLRYDLEREQLAFVVWHEPPEAIQSEALAGLERAGLEIAAGISDAAPLLVPRAGSLIAGWVACPAGADDDELARLQLDPREFPRVFAACGSPAAGVEGFRRSHREALSARTVARLTRRRHGTVTRYGDVALVALASADVEQARAFVRTELGPLAARDDRTARLAATLQVYLEENLSPRRAAQRLGVHENTIVNRIRVAQDDLPHPIEQRAAELQVALRIAALAADE